MKSLRELYRIGQGPSSSHTMAPQRAAEKALKRHPKANSFRIELYGSLAATGKGHLTHSVLTKVLKDRLSDIIWKPDEELPIHPNGMAFEALDENGSVIERWETYSIGGGALSDDEAEAKNADIYPLTTFDAILKNSEQNGESLWEYVLRYEGEEMWSFLENMWQAMKASLEKGLKTEGVLPGGLGVPRKARSLHRKVEMLGPHFREDGLLAAYAHAVAEENAAGGTIVTAPTCGASGVVPAVLYYLKKTGHMDKSELLQALAIAGLVGNLAKENGSISGAQIGCQGEVGVACAMAAAAATHVLGGSPRQIEYAAEMGMEHHLGLTCDPVAGLVQIPCIERNAHAAIRAMGCCHMALLSDGLHKISFDDVIQVSLETGHALPSLYRETSGGGLAKMYRDRKSKTNP